MAYKLGYGGHIKRILCKFWLHGVCTDRNCSYEHHSRYSEVALCKFILKNKECPYGAKCMFRHNEDFEDFLIGNNTMPDDTLLAAHTDPANYSVDQKDNQDAIVSKIADGTHSLPPHGDNLPLRNRFDGLDIEEVPPSSIVSTPPLPPPPSCCRKKEDFTSSSSLMRKEQPGKKKPAQKAAKKSNKKSNPNCQVWKKKENATDESIVLATGSAAAKPKTPLSFMKVIDESVVLATDAAAIKPEVSFSFAARTDDAELKTKPEATKPKASFSFFAARTDDDEPKTKPEATKPEVSFFFAARTEDAEPKTKPEATKPGVSFTIP
uniref:C3H1-type domain-containing protein n=1 Tax=Heterosigma akashiwo TaxID=2829 RepID=A0A7S3Y088_HETAK